MALIPWKPFSDFDKFFEDDDWIFPIFSGRELMKPAMDMYETEKEVIAEMNIPGFDPDKVDISVQEGILTISGETEEKKEEKNKNYFRKEIRKGSFQRMLKLSSAVKGENIEAVYNKGILKIVMQKAESKPSPKIKIKVQENKEK